VDANTALAMVRTALLHAYKPLHRIVVTPVDGRRNAFSVTVEYA
jgi:hypothetical protein